MFKILHTADSHFKRDRLDECIFNSMYIVDYATQTTPDLIVHAGDLLDRNTVVNSEEYLAAVDFIEDLSAIAPVLLVRGNHDPEGSFKVFNKFPNVYAFEKLDIFSFNQIDNIEYPYPVKVAVIPYQKTTSVSGETVSKAHVSVADQLKEHLINFDKEKNEKGLKLVVAHVSVSGAELANSERILGNEVMLSVSDFLQKNIDGVMLGHIHRNDQDILEGKPMAYSGSHYRTRFDEVMEPGFCTWTFDMNNDQVWYLKERKFIKTPARDMVQWDLDVNETKEYMGTGVFPRELLSNTDMKVIFSVPEGMSRNLDKDGFYQSFDLKSNNSTIKVSTVVEPKTNVRSSEIAKMKTKTEIFQEWATVSKIKLTKTTKEKFSELVEQCDG